MNKKRETQNNENQSLFCVSLLKQLFHMANKDVITSNQTLVTP